MRILVVEDDEDLAVTLVEGLRDQRYDVDLAIDGRTAERLVAARRYDLIVLDWSIPPPSGIDLLRRWRADGLDVPVLMLTARRAVSDRVRGLDSGADDYLSKPFAFAELFARIRTLLLRRNRPIARLSADDLELDRRAHEATLGGRPLHLTPKEFAVLHYLLTRSDEVVSRSELCEEAWDQHFDPHSNVVDVLISRLQQKLDGDRPDKLLHTVPAGYVIRKQRS